MRHRHLQCFTQFEAQQWHRAANRTRAIITTENRGASAVPFGSEATLYNDSLISNAMK